MKLRSVPVCVILLLAMIGCADTDPAQMSEADLRATSEAIHDAVITIDSHDDIPFDFATESVDPLNGVRQVNLENMRAGGLDVGFFNVFVRQTERTPENYAQAKTDAMTKFDAIHRMADEMYPDLIELAYSADDVERIRATGAPAIQINTGKGCHLDGQMVGHAVEHLTPSDGSVVFIENVGNLVCPAAFDLGEAHKGAILSVTEGEDKPIKYPDMFAASDLVLVNKIDLLPHLDFDVEEAISNARKVNPAIKVLKVSARTGEGMDAWLVWIMAARGMVLAGHPFGTAAE